ncbi:hypothetical protein D9M68_831790 [compost metagenome]
MGGDMPDQDGGSAAGHAVDVVVFGQPEALVSQALDVLRHRDRVAEGVGRVAALHDRGQVQDGKGNAGQAAHAETSVLAAGQDRAGIKRVRRKADSIYRDTWGVYRRNQPGPPATLCAGGLIEFAYPRDWLARGSRAFPAHGRKEPQGMIRPYPGKKA